MVVRCRAPGGHAGGGRSASPAGATSLGGRDAVLREPLRQLCGERYFVESSQPRPRRIESSHMYYVVKGGDATAQSSGKK
jgi:hypothetical protein